MKQNEITTNLLNYYNDKFAQFGQTPQGVDWNSKLAQEKRFEMLLEIIRDKEPFSLNDLGCGYGALYHYIKRRLMPMTSYYGYDVSTKMAVAADMPVIVADHVALDADYSVCSGIFHVKLDTPKRDWEAYITKAILSMYQNSHKGFAFNGLTDKVDFKKDHLYYSSPWLWASRLTTLSNLEIKVLEDYGLHDWTILCWKI